MPLTSQIEELDAILQKLIKNVNLDKIQHENFDDGASIGDADLLLQLLRAVGDVRLGANESAQRKQFCSLKN
jgi:predicted DsbA family dithiol-disulfide isomerase